MRTMGLSSWAKAGRSGWLMALLCTGVVAPAAADQETSAPPVAAPAAPESPAVAARFPDPAVTYRTPAFEPGHAGFTSNAELRTLLHGLVDRKSTRLNSSHLRLSRMPSSA